MNNGIIILEYTEGMCVWSKNMVQLKLLLEYCHKI
jgi:hypothetical protein